jgi:hypothetical protein
MALNGGVMAMAQWRESWPMAASMWRNVGNQWRPHLMLNVDNGWQLAASPGGIAGWHGVIWRKLAAYQLISMSAAKM